MANAKKSALKPDAVLGQHKIIKLLGVGGMAEVYLAEDARLGRKVALKLLPPELARDEQLFARFEREVKQISKLSHPNIVTMYDFGREGGSVYYTMQALERGDLSARIRKGALEPAEAMRIMRRMADAFAHAHAQGLVHRDVKPENILFDSEDEPVLTDFGIAKVLDSAEKMTQAGMTVGTPCYISPEQARGKDVDPRTDLYALGVICYELLTGKVPYKAQDSFATIMMHLTEPLPVLKGELAEYQPIIARLMAKDPDDRYKDAKSLIKALRQYRPDGGSNTPVPPAREKSAEAPSEAKPAKKPAPATEAETQLVDVSAARAAAKPKREKPTAAAAGDAEEKTQLMDVAAARAAMQAGQGNDAEEKTQLMDVAAARAAMQAKAPPAADDPDEKTQMMSSEALREMQRQHRQKKTADQPETAVDNAADLFGEKDRESQAMLKQAGRVIKTEPAPTPDPTSAQPTPRAGGGLTRLHILMIGLIGTLLVTVALLVM